MCIAAAADVHNGAIRDIRIALGGMAPVPLRCRKTEQVLRGGILNEDLSAAARESIRQEIQPITDIRSTREYRARVTANLLSEFLSSLP